MGRHPELSNYQIRGFLPKKLARKANCRKQIPVKIHGHLLDHRALGRIVECHPVDQILRKLETIASLVRSMWPIVWTDMEAVRTSVNS